MSESKKYHPDNVFLVSGYSGTPENLDANFVIAPNKAMSIESVTEAHKDFVAVSVISLSEMRQVVEIMELSATGRNPALIINKMFS